VKHFVGEKTPAGYEVTVLDTSHEGGGYPLDPRHDLHRYSDELNWETGPGRSQLALALLADALGDDEQARRLYPDFKTKVVARLEGDHFSLSEEDVRAAAWELRAGRVRA
jgi:hypothetical protein